MGRGMGELVIAGLQRAVVNFDCGEDQKLSPVCLTCDERWAESAHDGCVCRQGLTIRFQVVKQESGQPRSLSARSSIIRNDVVDIFVLLTFIFNCAPAAALRTASSESRQLIPRRISRSIKLSENGSK